MISRIRSAAVLGIDAFPVEVEVGIASGGNGEFEIVGLPDPAIRESRARIHAAIRSSRFDVPFRKITVNLAPADVRKEGSGFDLPVAIGVLAASGVVQAETKRLLMVGELSLDGRLRPVRNCLAISILARKTRSTGLIVPFENRHDAALATGVRVYAIQTLTDVVGFLNGTLEVAAFVADAHPELDRGAVPLEDFGDVRGQEHAKRAIEVAVAGAHNMLMLGPPGSGKTMLARRIPSIMPQMTLNESLDVTRIHSACGLLPPGGGLVTVRPFRSPHHSISSGGLIGGGSTPRPGEASMSHNGVLFLDELPEFPRHAIEVLRQPLEDQQVTIARAQTTLSFPASLILVGAMNPCRCGFLGDALHECRCTPKQIQIYRSKISGPLLDRIDIQIDVPPVPYMDLAGGGRSETSSEIRNRVVQARARQRKRLSNSDVCTNSRMRPEQIRESCTLTKECARILEKAHSDLGISARGYTRILKVARTIADLEASDGIKTAHLAEAIRYRKLDRGA
jgi:magnesium chelatase family protein